MRLAIDRALVLQLAGLGVLAFLLRLVPVLLSGGLEGLIDYDDGVYMGTALALVRDRIVYRDFFMIHPPGIVYVLTPFAALSWAFSDATAFAAGRVGMMVLGGLNTFLVGVVAARVNRTAAFAAAGLYAVWIVAAKVERSTWLVAPQNTLLLLALLALVPTLPGLSAAPITWRRAALVGFLLGLCGAIQIWGIVPAAVIFVWLFLRTFRQPGSWLRPLAAYSVAGFAAIAITFLPFLLAAGEALIRIVVFDQFGRTNQGVGLSVRLRQLEGLPHAIGRLGLGILPIVIYGLVLVAITYVAWRRPAARLWVALFVVQTLFLLTTPVFYGHYAGWIAPAAALCIGMVAVTAIEASARWPRGPTVVKLAYGAGLALFLAATAVPRLVGFPSPSRNFDPAPVADAIRDARCPSGDNPSVLIMTGTLRRMLDNGCPLLVSPSGVSYDTDRNLRGALRTRPNQPEYQAAMQAYFGNSDALLFTRDPKNRGLTDATWNVIRAHLPVQLRLERVVIYLPASP